MNYKVRFSYLVKIHGEMRREYETEWFPGYSAVEAAENCKNENGCLDGFRVESVWVDDGVWRVNTAMAV